MINGVLGKLGTRRAPDNRAADSWAPDNWAPGPNCPGPNLPRTKVINQPQVNFAYQIKHGHLKTDKGWTYGGYSASQTVHQKFIVKVI